MAWAERQHQQERSTVIDVEADGITRDLSTGKALSMKELAVLTRVSHQWDFDAPFAECAVRILDLLDETDGTHTHSNGGEKPQPLSSRLSPMG